MMSGRKLMKWILSITLVALWLTGCGGTEPESTAVPTLMPKPATDTPEPTPIPETATPTRIVGIEVPVTIDGIQLQVASVEMHHRYEDPAWGAGWFEAPAPQDAVLAISLQVVSGDLDDEKLEKWQFAVHDEHGQQGEPGPSLFSGKTELETGKGVYQELTFLFAVKQSSESFVLEMPSDQNVTLDPIIQWLEE